MADREIAGLRAEISKQRKGGTHARYSDDLKARVLEFARRRHAEGGSFLSIVRELGLCHATFSLWKRAERQGQALPKLRRVVVSESAPTGGRVYSVDGPRGLRVTGLSLDEVKALLREDS